MSCGGVYCKKKAFKVQFEVISLTKSLSVSLSVKGSSLFKTSASMQ